MQPTRIRGSSDFGGVRGGVTARAGSRSGTVYRLGSPTQLAANKSTQGAVGGDVAIAEFTHTSFEAVDGLLGRDILEDQRRHFQARCEVMKRVEFVAKRLSAATLDGHSDDTLGEYEGYPTT